MCVCGGGRGGRGEREIGIARCGCIAVVGGECVYLSACVSAGSWGERERARDSGGYC